jgi:uncharacterized protein YlaI
MATNDDRFEQLADLVRTTQTYDLAQSLRFIQEARTLAAAEAEEMPKQRAKEEADRILRKPSIFGKIKDVIAMARKPRMRKIEQYLCDKCDKVIAQPTDGFIIQGNIYVADPTCRGGLIGDNIPPYQSHTQPPEEPTFKREDIREMVMCRTCFFEALGISQKMNLRPRSQDFAGTLARALRKGKDVNHDQIVSNHDQINQYDDSYNDEGNPLF